MNPKQNNSSPHLTSTPGHTLGLRHSPYPGKKGGTKFSPLIIKGAKQKFTSPPILGGARGGKRGFTLVELIVVISILAILGVIAFLSFKGYQVTARDSKRITNAGLIAKGIELVIAKGSAPNTSEASTGSNIQINGSGITFTGVYEDGIGSKFLSSIGIINDDLMNDSFQKYQYTYIPTKKYYQVMTTLEKQVGSAFNISNQLYAETTGSGYAFIKGNFPTGTGGIVGIIPADSTAFTAIVPDANGIRAISGTGTEVAIPAATVAAVGGSSTPPPPPPVGGMCGSLACCTFNATDTSWDDPASKFGDGDTGGTNYCNFSL